MAKVQQVEVPFGEGGAFGRFTLVTAGLRINTRPENRLGAVVEITGGASIASGKMYDAGSYDTGLLGSGAELRAPSSAQVSTTAGIVEVAGGVRFPEGFELLGEIWLGPLTAAGAGVTAGWTFGI
jgi:hypothetical protein